MLPWLLLALAPAAVARVDAFVFLAAHRAQVHLVDAETFEGFQALRVHRQRLSERSARKMKG